MRALRGLPTAIIQGLLLSWLISTGASRRHFLFVANLELPAFIHSLVFDDETLQFNRSRVNVADTPHSWITFNHDMTHIYGVSLIAPRISTYDVVNRSAISLTGAVAPGGRCANRTAAYVLASKRFPHYVFSASWPGPSACGMSSYTNPSGGLADMAYAWGYAKESGIGGMAFGWGPQLIYSADTTGDIIWTHSFGWWGETHFIGRYSLPPGSRPRHIATHPYGKYLYAVMESTSELVSYILDPYTGVVSKNDTRYSLLPPGYNASNYWAAEVVLSRSNKYLWATTRAKANTTGYGYVSGFLLDDDGYVSKKMFTVPTSTTGGVGNALSPAPWDDEWAVLTDFPRGYVQMWRMKGGKDSDNGLVYNNAEPVARLDIADGGCCSNALWYN